MAVVTIAGRVMTSLRVERAERVAEIENKRRLEAEQERNRLKNLLAAEGELAERVARPEKTAQTPSRTGVRPTAGAAR